MKIGPICGVRIILNPFFLLLVVFLGVAGFLPYAVILFAIVFLHELAHTIVSSAYGMDISEIELLPFGGVARSEKLHDPDPFAEIIIALAGPLTNGFLILLALVAAPYEVVSRQWLTYFIRANIAIGLFNLLPALPLDGGRVLRAYLCNRMGFRRATEVAARIGKFLAALLAAAGGVGFYLGYVNPSLMIVAFFIFFAAAREQGMAGYVFVRYLTRKKEEMKETGILPTEQLVASGTTPVKDIVRYFVPKRYHIILVMDEAGQITGFTTEMEVVDSLFEKGINTPLQTIVRYRYYAG